MRTDAERERLRVTFDTAADLYEKVRPEYPEELIDHLVRVAGLRPGDRLLEVGPGTGKATRAMARRGFRVTGIEMGANMAAVARRALAELGVPVEVVEARFEEWSPGPDDAGFDMVFAATAWHWIDPRAGYRVAASALRPGGHLAFWTAVHVFPDGGDRFFAEIQPLYVEVGAPRPSGDRWPRPGELPELTAEIEASGYFDVVGVRHFDWECVYDVDAYVDLLRTMSAHIDMQPWQRERIETEVRRRLSLRPDRSVRRHWGAVLHVARRR
jgi:SAM-dependent methyltransferase